MLKRFHLTVIAIAAIAALSACGATAAESDAENSAEASRAPAAPEAAEATEAGQAAQDAEAAPEPPADPADDDAKDDAHAWLERLEARAGEIDTLRARLRYDRIQGLLGDRQIRFGDLRYDAGPPQRFAVHFDRIVVDDRLRERRRHYVFDGHWLAESQFDRQLFIRRELVPEDEEAREMLSLDGGPFVLPLNLEKDKVLERFEVSLIPPRDDDDEHVTNTVHLRLITKPHIDSRTEQLDVWYDRDTRLPVRVRGEDRGDERWILQLIQTEIGEEVDEDVFDTKPPTDSDWRVEVNRLDERSE